MRFIATADTDIGISKDTNQDSVLIKHAKADGKEVLLAVVCDGMGGLSKGELASATVIRAFAQWFDEELPYELENVDLQVIGAKWSLLLKELNAQILEYSKENGIEGVGTTFSGILFIDDQYNKTLTKEQKITKKISGYAKWGKNIEKYGGKFFEYTVGGKGSFKKIIGDVQSGVSKKYKIPGVFNSLYDLYEKNFDSFKLDYKGLLGT